ncbi:Uncharacterised protein [Sporosarcina pasteurii]|uniref:Uncharacterized protein n=1 Tax=Sporosarcina pasteurii TaxID=1474 RepID=A0A380BIC4_SPOPA|nr:Uncharacterised protein [Sporosarcina pasteurii]
MFVKLHFEEWIKNEPGVSENTKELIDEAIICYRAQAYRAAYLFSFLSFQNLLKERMLVASCPPGYDEEYWKGIQSELRNDDKWEAKIIECVERERPAQIFNLSVDTKRQYLYWKDRRNDCAHAKSNKIGVSHVESFWLFFESNLSKFGVGGGKEALLEKLKVFLNPAFTPVDSDPTSIIKEIPLTVDSADYLEVIENVYELTTVDIFGPMKTRVWDEMFKLRGEFLDQLVEFIKTNQSLYTQLLKEDPSKVRFFANDPAFIRSLWYEMKMDFRTYKVIIGLLRHNLIPREELNEMISTVSSNNNDTFFFQVEEPDLLVLEESGFFSEFKTLAFVDMKINDFNWARENRNIIWHLIIRNGFDETIVEALNNTMSNSFIPWRLRDSILELFEEFPKLKEEYIDVNSRINGCLPDKLFNSN